MAKAAGLSEKSVRRIWHKHGLKPHLSRTFKVSNDPEFAEKLEAIIGLRSGGLPVAGLSRPETRARIALQGMDAAPSATPEQFDTEVAAEAPFCTKLVKDSGAKVA